MLQRFLGFVVLSAMIVSFATLLSGCESRPMAAEKLFQKGQYQQVMEKYPDLEVARRARAKLAENLLQEKDYNRVIREFGDTPAAFQAKESLAQDLFDRGQYQAIIDSFPGSSVASMAKQRLADSLFANAQFDLLMQKYPDTPKAMEVKEDRAKKDLEKAKKLKGQEKKQALTDITRSYAGTQAQKEASQMLSEIYKAESAKANKGKKK